MEIEKSCGCIITKDDKVLLICARDDDGKRFWSFPKGHQEDGESDVETAIRETREETGLDDYLNIGSLTMILLLSKSTVVLAS